MYLRTLLWIVFVVCANHSFSQHIDLRWRNVVGNRMGYWRDAADTVNINNIEKVKFASVGNQSVPNFGFDRASYWFKIDLTNRAPETHRLLEIDFSPLDYVDFYIQDSTGAWTNMTAGDMRPLQARD